MKGNESCDSPRKMKRTSLESQGTNWSVGGSMFMISHIGKLLRVFTEGINSVFYVISASNKEVLVSEASLT
jgi:hypothetical protein